jgi:hypothetical protein
MGVRAGHDVLESRRAAKAAGMSILVHAASELRARFCGSDCRFWSLSGITRVFPIADEAAWEHASKSVAFADEMSLIEIPKFMDNVRP